ncbi:alpha-1B-glycoprotein-like [Chelonoidis abingdonii]|uniref:alpha-1B-glycoprotein-like n=1 Tax=Chelonoidis abingdonii TaxID=106734 RepID=UPI003F498575
MASAFTILLLGCWLAGWSRMLGEGSYPKPSISVSPSEVIPVGGNVTIWCWHQLLDMRILLYKDEDENYLHYTDPAGSEAEFPITSARREHGGSYTCRYSNRTGEVAYSEPSDPVQIIVADPSLPRPSISLSPTGVTAPGADVTIWCQGQRRDVRFFLHKAGDLNPQRHMDPAGAGAEFHIPTVGQQHGGNYSCSYRPQSEPFVSSQPSDTVELVVAEPSYPKPSISVSPGEEVLLGTAVTIRCWGQHPGVQFVLNKEGRHFPPADSDGLEVEFSTNNVHRDLGGSYTCSCHSRSEPFAVSYPSDPMELVVRDPSFPRPSISLSPTGVTAPGANVTIRCQGQRRDVRFFLHKAGDLNPQRHMDPAGARAEFRIPIVGWQHGGNYSCSYRPRSEPFISSQPSDTMELVVADPSLPRPNISLSPTGVTAPGANVTIRCQGPRWNVRFFLHKAGDLNPQRHMDPAGAAAEFHIPTMGRQHRGSYSCSYRPGSEPFISSLPSDPVQLVVAEPSYPKPSISLLSPSWGVFLGGAVTVQCCGQNQGLQFMLNKEGRYVQSVNSDFLALFHINNVRQEHGGSYSCSYHSQSEPSAMSDPSDLMELVVRDPSLPRPNISLNVTMPGADATIRCQGQRQDVRFFLYKAGDLNPQQHMDPAANVVEFRIPTVGRQHGGNYSCSYRPQSQPFISSEPSDPVKITAAADFTNINIVRLGLSAGVLLVLGLILAEAHYSRPRGDALGAWIRPHGEEKLPRERAASPRGTETPAQTPLPPNTPAPENPP